MGFGAMAVWHGAHWLFGSLAGLYILPSLAVALVWLALPYRQAAVLLVDSCVEDATSRSILSAALVVLWSVGWMSVQPDWHVGEWSLPAWLGWIRPASKIDRALLLMPLWGGWVMLILPHLLPALRADPAVEALRKGTGPLTAALVMGGLMAASIGYFNYMPWTHLTMPLAAIAGGVGGGLALARRAERTDRSVLLAANLLAQMAWMVAFLANARGRFG